MIPIMRRVMVSSFTRRVVERGTPELIPRGHSTSLSDSCEGARDELGGPVLRLDPDCAQLQSRDIFVPMQDWRRLISVDPEVCHGKARIKDTRVPVSIVLDNLADGLSPEEVVRSYPSLTLEGVRAALAYAAEITREQVVSLP